MPLRFLVHSRLAAICAFLALTVLLAAPFSGYAQMAVPTDQPFMSSTGCCDNCPTELPGATPSSADGCCTGEGCCSACNTPLGSVLLLPALTTFTGSLAGLEPFLHFPEVYLPIFVPPESLS